MNRSVAGIALLVITLPAAFAQAPVSCDLPRAERAAQILTRAQNVTTERIDSPRCIKSNASLILSSGI